MREILEILEKDARATPKEIARMLDMSEEDVRRKIDELEKSKTIVKYKTVINWERAGEERAAALIEVKVAPQRDVGFDSIAERIYRFPEARTVYLVSGTYDLQVEVVGKTMRDISRFVTEKLAPLEGVQGTVTHFLLKRYKEDGDILEVDEQEVKRLPLSL
ncbi:MAG: Lrp/AsnC family transcriptional regulator [Chloroflexi bacterium]|nr:Lrp/AsnC family transcriptional regulator [Chloroflexota bacterium]